MKKSLILLVLLLVLGKVNALSYTITSHEINVEADKQGKVTVSEKYFMVFQSKEKAEEFKQRKSKELGFKLENLEKFDPNLTTNFGPKSYTSLKIDFTEEPSGELLYSLEFRYTFNEPAFNKKEIGRKVLLEINKSFVRPLSKGTDFVIPANTTLTFILPPQSMPNGELLNQQNVRVVGLPTAPRVIIPGSFLSNEFDFGYYYFKPIPPSFSIALFVKDFAENTSRETQLALGFVIGMISLALYAARNRIKKRITNFIIKHTDLEGETRENME